jgi:GT2 family glycosyltransferase
MTTEGRSSPPEVLVVIVNFNSGELLMRAVTATTRQTFADYRVVVVDNGSSDDSVAALRERHPDTEVILAGANLGFAAANNLAVRTFPESRWIALVNPDAFPEPTWLQVLVEAARTNPDVAAFASRTVDARDSALLDGAGDVYHVSGRYWRRGYRCPAKHRYEQSEEIFTASAAAALYSRVAWEQVGGMDEDFFCYGEDVDLGFRLQLAGYRCLYLPASVAYHYGSAITGARSDFSTYYGQRNLVWVYIKNMPTPLFWLLLPYHLILNASSLIGCILRGQGQVALSAKVDAIRGISNAWRKRSTVRQLRRTSLSRIWGLFARGWPWPRC